MNKTQTQIQSLSQTLMIMFALLLISTLAACGGGGGGGGSDSTASTDDPTPDPTPETKTCTVAPEEGKSALCYIVDDGDTVTLEADNNNGELLAYYNMTSHTTHIKTATTNTATLELQALATGTGSFDLHQEGRSSSFYQTVSEDYYTQSSSSDKDGGTLTFETYATEVGERMKGTLDIKLCKYDITTHVVDCDNHLISITGAFDIERTANQE